MKNKIRLIFEKRETEFHELGEKLEEIRKTYFPEVLQRDTSSEIRIEVKSPVEQPKAPAKQSPKTEGGLFPSNNRGSISMLPSKRPPAKQSSFAAVVPRVTTITTPAVVAEKRSAGSARSSAHQNIPGLNYRVG